MKIRTLTATAAGLTGALLVMGTAGIAGATAPSALCVERGANGLPRLVLCSTTLQLPELAVPGPVVGYLDDREPAPTTPAENDQDCTITLPDGRQAAIGCDLGSLMIDPGVLEMPSIDVPIPTTGEVDEQDDDGAGDEPAPQLVRPDPTDLPRGPFVPQAPTINLPTSGGGTDDGDPAGDDPLIDSNIPDVEVIVPAPPVEQDPTVPATAEERAALDDSMIDSHLSGIDGTDTFDDVVAPTDQPVIETSATDPVTPTIDVADAADRAVTGTAVDAEPAAVPLPRTGGGLAGLVVGLGLTGIGGGALARLTAVRRRR